MSIAAEKAIHIFVQIDHQKEVRVEFHQDRITGREIKQKAGVPSDYELAIHRGHKLEPVRDDEVIEIHNGERFIAVPGGSVS